MAGADSSQTTVVVHPLALVSVSDHVLRDNIGQHSRIGAIGMLFGTTADGRTEVHRAIECFLKPTAVAEIDQAFVQNQVQLTTTVFPTFSIVGCYIAKHGQLDRNDISIYQQMRSHSTSPVLLHWDLASSDARRLPVQVYTGIPGTAGADVAMEGADAGMQVAVMKIDASEPERIAIDYIGASRGSSSGRVGEGATVEQLLATDPTLQGLKASHAALGALRARVDVLLSFASAMQSGSIPSTPSSRAILRSIGSLLARLPIAAQGSKADRARAMDTADSALVELASRLVESIANLAVVSEKAGSSVEGGGSSSSAVTGAYGQGAGGKETQGATRAGKGTGARHAAGRWGDRGGSGGAGYEASGPSRRERPGAS